MFPSLSASYGSGLLPLDALNKMHCVPIDARMRGGAFLPTRMRKNRHHRACRPGDPGLRLDSVGLSGEKTYGRRQSANLRRLEHVIRSPEIKSIGDPNEAFQSIQLHTGSARQII
jgi:hypothetical protein